MTTSHGVITRREGVEGAARPPTSTATAAFPRTQTMIGERASRSGGQRHVTAMPGR
jgi:hypothetical protein